MDACDGTLGRSDSEGGRRALMHAHYCTYLHLRVSFFLELPPKHRRSGPRSTSTSDHLLDPSLPLQWTLAPPDHGSRLETPIWNHKPLRRRHRLGGVGKVERCRQVASWPVRPPTPDAPCPCPACSALPSWNPLDGRQPADLHRCRAGRRIGGHAGDVMRWRKRRHLRDRPTRRDRLGCLVSCTDRPTARRETTNGCRRGEAQVLQDGDGRL
jgi:hypothetical protein